VFVDAAPDLRAMTAAHGAAVLIGDPALEADHEALGLLKTDLGEAWRQLTGRPFVYAAWTGRPGAITARDVEALVSAQAEGLAHVDDIAAQYAPADPARRARAARYLRDNVRYALGEAERQGLQLFLDYAADLGLGPRRRTVTFY
jgi:chorismate dehydratase